MRSHPAGGVIVSADPATTSTGPGVARRVLDETPVREHAGGLRVAVGANPRGAPGGERPCLVRCGRGERAGRGLPRHPVGAEPREPLEPRREPLLALLRVGEAIPAGRVEEQEPGRALGPARSERTGHQRAERASRRAPPVRRRARRAVPRASRRSRRRRATPPRGDRTRRSPARPTRSCGSGRRAPRAAAPTTRTGCRRRAAGTAPAPFPLRGTTRCRVPSAA